MGTRRAQPRRGERTARGGTRLPEAWGSEEDPRAGVGMDEDEEFLPQVAGEDAGGDRQTMIAPPPSSPEENPALRMRWACTLSAANLGLCK